MIPGIALNMPSRYLADTLQFGRYDYNGGYSTNVTVTVDLKALFPYITANDDLRMDILWWSGSWCDGWKDRVAFYFKFGTSYNVALSGGGSKNHVIYFQYAGGDTVDFQHYYAGDSTSSPAAEISVDRLYYLGTSGQANSYTKNLAA